MNGQKQNFFRIFLAGVLILLSFAVYAQENTVTGKVYDVSGEPIIGASVVIQGTTQGTITDMDGAFQLKAQPSQTLVVSFLGYKDVILPIGNKNNFKVTLEEDSKKLDEVVVVGYATQKKVNNRFRGFCVIQGYPGHPGSQYSYFVARSSSGSGTDSKRCTGR